MAGNIRVGCMGGIKSDKRMPYNRRTLNAGNPFMLLYSPDQISRRLSKRLLNITPQPTPVVQWISNGTV